MSDAELLRHEDPIREEILQAQREVALAEHAAAVALWGLENEITVASPTETEQADA